MTVHLADCHVVIVNFNSARYLTDCLASLVDPRIADITILDNSSTNPNEASALAALKLADSRIRLIKSEQNVGFGAGVNRAVASLDLSGSEYVWILNPDTTVTPGCVAGLCEALDANLAAIVSPVIMSGLPGSKEVWFAGGTLDLRRGTTLHWKTVPNSEVGDVVSCSFITGAAPMFAFSTWERLGGFREDLFMYWEDADLSRRATEAQMILAVVLHACIWHVVGGSTRSSGKSALWYYYMHRNRLIVCRGTRNPWSLIVGFGLPSFARLLARAVREPDHRLQKCLSSLRGIWAGLKLAK